MSFLDRYFLTSASGESGLGHTMSMSHDPWLVAVSVLVACAASLTSFILLDRINAPSSRLPKRAWLAIGAVSMGSGIWSMHFIAMLAMELAAYTFYNLPLTALSVVFAIFASGIAFAVVTNSSRSRVRLAVGGVLMGAGIGAMHYTGMAALHLKADIRYDPWLFALSVAVAVAFSTVALWLMREQLVAREHRNRLVWRAFAAVIMGGSIAAMHYTGMAASNFLLTPEFMGPSPDFGSGRLAELVIAGTAIILLMSFMPAMIDQSHRIDQLSSELSVHKLFEDSGIGSDAVIVFSENGEIETINRAAEKAFGYSGAEAAGLQIESLFAPGDLEKYRTHARDAVLNETKRPPDIHGLRKDGSRFLAELSLTHMTLKRGQQTLCVCRDITLRRMADEAMRDAKERAEAANKAKSEFLAMMSHEIRTPMNGVIGMTELLLDTSLDEEQRNYTNALHRSGKALLTIINDILDISKLEAGHMTLEQISYDPHEFVPDIAMLFRSECGKKGIAFNTFVAADIPHGLIGDPGRVRQVLVNLAGNAVKFTETGSVTIKATRYGHDGVDDFIRFEVVDTGIGISEKARERLFEKFVQADLSTTRKYGGTGLGLAISRNLVELMGGEIGVRSVEGTGTTFWFTVPMNPHLAVAQTEAA